MELKNQCVSLELAKKLKELGCKQKSLFYWLQVSAHIGTDIWELVDEEPGEYYPKEQWCSAFTVAELGEMLPRTQIDNQFTSSGTYWKVYCPLAKNYIGEADTEANARAKMKIYLLENKLIQP